MGLTKTEKFTNYQNEVADVAKAMAHPARIAILQHIIKKNQCICGEIVEEVGLAQSTVSQHLKELKKAGLLKGNVDGVKVCYCLNLPKWKTIAKMFDEFLQKGSDSCC